MGNKIRVGVALLIIVGMAFWAFNTLRERGYAGSDLSFAVGSGHVVVTNPGSEPIPVEMRADRRSSSFRVESAELQLKQSSKRQGNGRNAYHAVSFDLPPGQTMVDVTRGSGVQFVSPSNQRIQAVVTPHDDGSAHLILAFAGLVIFGGLYYISGAVEHRWVGTLRRNLPKRIPRVRRKAV